MTDACSSIAPPLAAAVSAARALERGPVYHDRLGLARLVESAMKGHDMVSLRDELAGRADDLGATMDLAVVEQLLQQRDRGLDIQAEVLQRARCFRSFGFPAAPQVRVLALAAPMDIGGNTPIEFLISDAGVGLTTLYLVPDQPIGTVPDHDVAIVTMSGEEASAACLDHLMGLAQTWSAPLLNQPDRVRFTNRDHLCPLIKSIPGLHINESVRITGEALEAVGHGSELPAGFAFPVIARPIGSHAGNGLVRLCSPSEVPAYLASQDSSEFFLSPFTDYRSADGNYRKYRIVFVDGRPYACHMAISDQWAIWYLNAEMQASLVKRWEEAHFMAEFDAEFGLRHHDALAAIADRLRLDYFVIDCAETKDGKLLVFEAGITMIVHDLDQAAIFSYKHPQMQKVFAAFTAMLKRKASEHHDCVG